MKKKALFLVFLAGTLLLLAGCGSDAKKTDTTNTKVADVQKTSDTVPVILNQEEYLLYQNVFYNGYADSNTGAVTKRGVYATIQDAYNNVTRHYVWGYLDKTLCCDWQWEFVPAEGVQLPVPGSEILVTGDFQKDDNALDGYWIMNAIVTTETAYTGKTAELSMQAMSDTLERVQMINIKNRKESFEGKAFTAYGRIADTNTLEDPYYGNQSWSIVFQSSGSLPPVGSLVQVQGTVRDGQLDDSVLETIN